MISLSLILLSYTGYSYAVAIGFAWDTGFSSQIESDNQGKIFYGLGESLEGFKFQELQVVYQHESGDWGFAYDGENSTITEFAVIENNYITAMNNSAALKVINNNSVSYPFEVFQPKFVRVTNDTHVTQINQDNFILDINAFNLSPPPVVYWDATQSLIIAKNNQSSNTILVEFSFQENPIIPDVVTVLPNNQDVSIYFMWAIIIALLIAILGITVIFINRRHN